MQLDVRGPNLEVTVALRDHVTKRLRFALGRVATRLERVAVSTPARRITSSTSMATASMTAASASAGWASRIRAIRTNSTRHVTVHTDKLGPLLKDHRIPLVFLEACQTAQAEDTSESVASELLQCGVASVVAMSHSVLVETARRFVETFYAGLAHGQRVGDAMLDGQRGLKDDTFRGRIFGAGELRLEDWFVPVLFQEKDDPQLFRRTPAPQTQEDLRTIQAARLGGLPPVPETGFIGRSRELLALQRLLFSGE